MASPRESRSASSGVTGMTAYFGITDVGQVKAGDVVVVSGAAGATGSAAGQIAKIKGAKKVVGIAGGAEKCAFIVDELGFDDAIDYKNDNVAARLRETCPDGIDLYFDNVGGSILDDCLGNLALRGRVVLCGAISTYNSDGPPPGPSNYLTLVVNRGRMEGFIILDYLDRFPAAQMEVAGVDRRRQDQVLGAPRRRAWNTHLTRSTCCSAAATPAR